MKIEKIVAGLLVASLAVTPLTGVLETKAAETKAIEVYNQEITVYSFAQLENILKNGYGNILIKLAANITLEKGTKVNANITSVTIDGQGNTLTEAVASSASGTILINNKNTSQFTLKNMDIIGKNYYGPVVVDNSIRGANLYYENINYKGPQLIHNLSGYAHLSGNNKVTITQEIKNGNVAQEFAQATGVNISGKLVLDHGSLYDSVFWFGSANYAPSFLNILDDADVSVTVRNKDMFYVNDSASKPFSLRVGKNAKFNVVTYGNLFRSASMGAESISFEEGSDTQMTRINIQARELINLKNGSKPGALTVAKDASLTLGNVAGTVITGAKNSSVQLNNPRNVTLQGEAGNLLKYAGSLTFNTQKVEAG
ncbi:pectate lyase-like adhesive domain-containing protein [Listeria grandensis]|uniref:pectate lyase-like adhesive domain-containing protein n=1 Tax=Listeria grandensis TaxID=1494963 RepID=UPI0004B10412|nr:pectate lyase-like adhesive domain-containing protein [Listeria grandensis]